LPPFRRLQPGIWTARGSPGDSRLAPVRPAPRETAGKTRPGCGEESGERSATWLGRRAGTLLPQIAWELARQNSSTAPRDTTLTAVDVWNERSANWAEASRVDPARISWGMRAAASSVSSQGPLKGPDAFVLRWTVICLLLMVGAVPTLRLPSGGVSRSGKRRVREIVVTELGAEKARQCEIRLGRSGGRSRDGSSRRASPTRSTSGRQTANRPLPSPAQYISPGDAAVCA
jgi:hypothetical protein